MPFFKYYPTTNLDIFGDGTTVPIIDLFSSVALVEDRLNDVSLYVNYEIQNGARPDVVSQELYGTSELHWTFFLINDELREGIKMWPMSDFALNEWIDDIHECYGSIELLGLTEPNDFNHNVTYGLDLSSPHIAVECDRGRRYAIETYRSDRQQIGLRKGGLAEIYWSDRIDVNYKYNVAFPPYFRLEAQTGDNGSGGLAQAVLDTDGYITDFRIADFGKGYRVAPKIISDFTPTNEASLKFYVPKQSYGAIPQKDWLHPSSRGKQYIDSPFITVQRAGSYDPLHIPYYLNIDIEDDGQLEVIDNEYQYSLDYTDSVDMNTYGQLFLNGWNIDAINGTYEQVQKGDNNDDNLYLSSQLESLYTNQTEDAHFDENTVWIKKGEYVSADFTKESGYYFIHYNDSHSDQYPMLMLRFLSVQSAVDSTKNNFDALYGSVIIAYCNESYNPSSPLKHPSDKSLSWHIPIENDNGFLTNPVGYNTIGSNATHGWDNTLYLSDYNSSIAGTVSSYLSSSDNGYIVSQQHSVIHQTKPIGVFVPPIDVTSGNDAIQNINSIRFVQVNEALEGTLEYDRNNLAYDSWNLEFEKWQQNAQMDRFGTIQTNSEFAVNPSENYQNSAKSRANVSTGHSNTAEAKSYYELYYSENRAKESIRIIKPEYIRDFVRVFKSNIKNNDSA